MPTDEELEAMSDAALLERLRRAHRSVQTATALHEAERGRIAAWLHDRCGWSWPQIGRSMDMNASTIWRWAEPYLQRD